MIKYNSLFKLIVILVIGLFYFKSAYSQTIMVTNTNDVENTSDPDYPGSFRAAIDACNDPGQNYDQISFNINIAGVDPPYEIQINSDLPDITSGIVIDGSTQPSYGYTGNEPKIEIVGTTGLLNGLVFSDVVVGSIVKYVCIKGFEHSGIMSTGTSFLNIENCVFIDNGKNGTGHDLYFYDSDNCNITGNHLGHDVSSNISQVENRSAISLTHCNNFEIGGISSDKFNYILKSPDAINGGMGIAFYQGCNNIAINGNGIAGNDKEAIAYALVNNNNYYEPPEITEWDYDNEILYGTANPNDYVEIFSSDGIEEAIHLLGTATVIGSNWSLNLPGYTSLINRNYVVATARNPATNTNTSPLSFPFAIEPTVNWLVSNPGDPDPDECALYLDDEDYEFAFTLRWVLMNIEALEFNELECYNIDFDIDNSTYTDPPHVIELQNPLDPITRDVSINGHTEPDYIPGGDPVVRITGFGDEILKIMSTQEDFIPWSVIKHIHLHFDTEDQQLVADKTYSCLTIEGISSVKIQDCLFSINTMDVSSTWVGVLAKDADWFCGDIIENSRFIDQDLENTVYKSIGVKADNHPLPTVRNCSFQNLITGIHADYSIGVYGHPIDEIENNIFQLKKTNENYTVRGVHLNNNSGGHHIGANHRNYFEMIQGQPLGSGISIGIDVSDGCKYNLIPDNQFIGLTQAIELNNTGNEALQKPIITDCTPTTVSGTISDPNCEISVFSSNNPQEAIELLGSVDANPDGTWVLEDVYFGNAMGVVAIAVAPVQIPYGMQHNTSELSDFYSIASLLNNIWHVDLLGSDTEGDGSDDNPFRTIQHAIDVSANDDIVLVHQGTFEENIDIGDKYIQITSWFPFNDTPDHEVITSTIIKGVDANNPVIKIGSTVSPVNDEVTKITGLTIQNGYNPVGTGGGIHIFNENSPVLEDLIITFNYAQYGGGIYCENSSELILKRCEISFNTSANFGGGIFKQLDNVANRGDALVESSLIYQNSATHGGGIYAVKDDDGVQSEISIVNTTISSNNSSINGAGLFGQNSYITLLNSIVYYHTGPENIFLDNCVNSITYSCLEDGSAWAGTNCITTEPGFVDHTTNDYRLAPCNSTCIGVGSNTGAPSFDLLKMPMPMPEGSVYDMGCYEYPLDPVNPISVFFTGLSEEFCSFGSPVTLTGYPDGGWYTGEGIEGTTFDPSKVTSTGPIEITYHYVDDYGCEYTSTLTTLVHQIDVRVKYTNPNCITPASGTIWVEVTGGSGNYTYHWTTPNGSIPSGQEHLSSLDPITAGTYVLEFEDLGHELCDPLIISQWVPTASVEVEMENTGTCGMPTAQVVAKASTVLSPWSPTTVNYTFEWFKNDNGTGTSLSTDIQASESTMSLSPGEYYVIVTDNLYQCSETKYFTVWETEALTVVIENVVHNFCYGDSKGSATAYATGGLSGDPGAPNTYFYLWTDQNGAAISLSATVNNLSAGTYNLLVIVNGCIVTDQVIIEEEDVLEFAPVPLDILNCQVAANALGGTPPYTYTWEKKDDNGVWQFYARTNTNTVYGLGVGDYRVTFTDIYNCDSPNHEEFQISMDGIIKDYAVCYRFVGFYELPEPEEIEKPEVPDFNVRDIELAFRDEVAECRTTVQGLGSNMFEGECENVFTEDELTIDIPMNLYHYTLYYYDRAGNLVKTVPPEGVSQTANHTFETKYNYNSSNQLIEQETTDGGITNFWYNEIGQIRFSQNAEQNDNGKFSYTKYDELGRIIEVGESDYITSLDNYVEDADHPTLNNSQQVYTVYNTKTEETHFGKSQRFLQNRVSYSYNADDVYTYYSYDPHGNVEWLIQDIPGFGKSYISYEYDLISGNITRVNYNTSFETDNFFHKYEYDDDNRLKLVESSRDGVIWDKDADYEYYNHGPLKRIELGEDKVQGLDYVYTIQGWLKAINHPSMDPVLDPGNDTGTELFAKDAFAMSLGYYDGDYITNANHFATSNNYMTNNLYNGNISSWTRNNFSYDDPENILQYINEQMGFEYQYDVLNRIKSSELHSLTGGVWTSNDDYATSYNYDANGNIEELSRNAHGNPGLSELDLLEYTYETGTNKLTTVEETTSGALDGTMNDITGTTTYFYDLTGNLEKTVNGTDITQIEWNVYGKISKITKTPETNYIEYKYDAAGNRVRKDVYKNPEEPSTRTSTYYVRDAQGNIMAVYERNITKEDEKYFADYKITEQPIYGSDRLGVAITDKLIAQNIPYDIELDNARLDRSDTWQVINRDAELSTWMYPIKDGLFYKMKRLEFNEEAFSVEDEFTSEQNNIELISNLSVAEDLDNNLQLYSYTVLQSGINNICQIHASGGNLLTGSDRINSKADAQSVFMKKPGDNNKYYLITLGNDNKLYYHIIDMNQLEARSFRLSDQVDPNHVLADVDNYGHSFATIEKYEYSTNATSCILYYTVYKGESLSGLTRLYAIELTEDGFQEPVLISTYEDTFFRPKAGEIQISPDGDQIAVAYYNATGTCIAIEDLKSNYLTSEGSTSFSMGWDAGDYMSFDFSGNSDYLYISVVSHATNRGLYKYQQSLETLSSRISEEYIGSVRRGVNDKIYVAVINEDYILEVTDEPFLAERIRIQKLTDGSGLLALQPHRVIESVVSRDDILAKRYIDQKLYEFNDHLGNVNTVISDLKEPQSTAGGVPTNFQVSLKSYNNYYPFGMMMPGRSYVPEKYRFGFQGQEKDDEISGTTGGHISYKYRIHDTRIGRFLSIDPLTAKYPYNSPYAFSENRVIDGIELEGLEYLDVDNANIPFMGVQQNQQDNYVELPTYTVRLGSETFENVRMVNVGGSNYYDLGQHMYYGQNGWSNAGTRAEQQTEASRVGIQLISNIDALPNMPANVNSPAWNTTSPADITLSQQQANLYADCWGVCYAVSESRANQAYIDVSGSGVVNLTPSGRNVDHRVAATVGTNDPLMGYGAGGPFANHGVGTAVDNNGAWAGQLQRGAVLQIWHSTDVANLYANGGHSQIFREYSYGPTGNITGMYVSDNSGGIEYLDRNDYTNETIFGVNLNDR